MKTYILLVIVLICCSCKDTQDNSEMSKTTLENERYSIYLLSNANLNSLLNRQAYYSEIDIAVMLTRTIIYRNEVREDSLNLLDDKYRVLKRKVRTVQDEINNYHKLITHENAIHLNEFTDEYNSSRETPNNVDIRNFYRNIRFLSNKTNDVSDVIKAFNEFFIWSKMQTDSLENNSMKIADVRGYVVGDKDELLRVFSESIVALEKSNQSNNLKTLQLVLATENSMYHVENWILHFYYKIIKRKEKETEFNEIE